VIKGENHVSTEVWCQSVIPCDSTQTMSMYGSQEIAFVIPWLVLTRTGSAADAGLVAFAMGTASFVGVLTGGQITDRLDSYGRRKPMPKVIADIVDGPDGWSEDVGYGGRIKAAPPVFVVDRRV
jgi:hypothetical protein